MSNYYTADPHFGHPNIIEHCNRPFSSVEEMNEFLVDSYNQTCSRHDTLIFLGDISCYQFNPVPYLRKIKARKVLFTGNHDRHSLKYKAFRDCFVSIKQRDIIRDSGYTIFVSHFPVAEWDGFYKGIYHFYGHTHNSKIGGNTIMEFLPTAINVGVDKNDFTAKTAKQLISEREKLWTPPRYTMEEFMNRTTYVKAEKRGNHTLDTERFKRG